MIRFILSFLGGLFSLMTLSVVVMPLGVGAIFWVYSKDLPSIAVLRNYTPATTSRIFSAEGQLLLEVGVEGELRITAPIEDIPPLVQQAFVSAEDKNFFEHPGYDIRGIAAAIVDVVRTRGEVIRGASTITQQVVKNLLLDSSRSAERKIQEIVLAARITQAVPKERILELYLNEIYFGPRDAEFQNAYGIVAAARVYYNKSLDELNAQEAAYLAALPKAPSDYHPVDQLDRALERRNFVLREMFENGYITEDEYQVAVASPLQTVMNGDFEPYGGDSRTPVVISDPLVAAQVGTGLAPVPEEYGLTAASLTVPPMDYFGFEARRQLFQDFGSDEFKSGGFTARITVDPELQALAATSLRGVLEDFDRQEGVWTGTGEVLSEEQLASEELWRAALADVRLPRDVNVVNPWLPAVVLGVTGEGARVGIEGVAEVEGGHIIPPRDLDWASGAMGDLLSRGDVVLVRPITADADGSFVRWSLRQVPEVQGAFMAMDVNTGRVLAMQGGFWFEIGLSELNRATQARRQPGSAFKPFVYAAALDSGYTPATIVMDAPIEVEVQGGEVWRPNNASDEFYGITPLRTGIEQSRNVMTVRLAQEVGMEIVSIYAEEFGVYDDMNPFLANALGSEETTLYDLVAAYAMFANGGERVEPTLVDRVQDRYGNTVFRHDERLCVDCQNPELPEGLAPAVLADRERVINEVTAYQITSMMEGVVDRGTASGTVNLPVAVAGKTGTTNEARDVWFVGFTSNIVAGCYIGYDTPRSLGAGAGGGSLCGPVFNAFMEEAIEQFGGTEFPVPEDCVFIKIDRFTGARVPDEAEGPGVVSECFREGEIPVFGVTFVDLFAFEGAELPLFEEVREAQENRQVITTTGTTVILGPNADFGTLTGGGQY